MMKHGKQPSIQAAASNTLSTQYPIGRFDDDRAHREAADDAVALREHAGERRHRWRRFTDDRPWYCPINVLVNCA